MTDEASAPESAVAETRIRSAAQARNVDAPTVADALTVLHAELLSRHHEYEQYPYVTVDGTRAYRLPQSVVEDLLAEFDFEEGVADAVRQAHTEEARMLFAESVEGDDAFEADEDGLAIGIDTAEQY